ncbi:unnamed protein product, partial [Gordionus sp. m RMFG-2023]
MTINISSHLLILVILCITFVDSVHARFPFTQLNAQNYFKHFVPSSACSRLNLELNEIDNNEGGSIYGFSDHHEAIRCVPEEESQFVEINLDWSQSVLKRLDPRDLRYFVFKKRPNSYLTFLQRERAYQANDNMFSWLLDKRSSEAYNPRGEEFVSFLDKPYTGSPIRLTPGSDYLLCIKIPGQWPLRDEHCKGIMIDMKKWRRYWIAQYFSKVDSLKCIPQKFKSYIVLPILNLSKLTIYKFQCLMGSLNAYAYYYNKARPSSEERKKLTNKIQDRKTLSSTILKTKSKDVGIVKKIQTMYNNVKTFMMKKLNIKDKSAFDLISTKRKNSIAWIKTKIYSLKAQSKNPPWKFDWSPMRIFYKYLHTASTCIICFPYYKYISNIIKQTYDSVLNVFKAERKAKWISDKSFEKPAQNLYENYAKTTTFTKISESPCDRNIQTSLSIIKTTSVFDRIRYWVKSFYPLYSFLPKLFTFNESILTSHLNSLLSCNST